MSWEDFERKMMERQRQRDLDVAAIEEALRESKAIRGQMGGKRSEPVMAIVSGETADRGDGELRVTFFRDDGPLGHATKRTEREIAEEIRDQMLPPYAPMTEAEVIAWTTTDRYEIGSRQVACVQAINTLSWYASRAGRRDLFEEAQARADAEVYGPRGSRTAAGYDRALAILHAAIRDLPTPNPRRALVRNPAWVTSALADHYAVLDDKVPARWMPQLAHVTNDRKKLVADLVEFGCGAYGCVLATSDPETVLKVTTDDTEAEFAAQLAPTLVAPICVDYHLVVRLSSKHEGRPVHLLWREAADDVGNIARHGQNIRALMQRQHRAGQLLYEALISGEEPADTRRLLDRWLGRVAAMGQSSVLRPLSEGLLRVWKQQRIVFCDLHDGNLGRVKRAGGDAWVITDPGHVASLSDPDTWV